MAGLISIAMGIVVLFSSASAGAFTTNDAVTLFNAYNTAFHASSGGFAFYKADNGGSERKADFWRWAEEIEMVEDVYEHHPTPATLGTLTNLMNGFVHYKGRVWTYNEFNDDIIWMCIASARAYEITHINAYRVLAKSNFDACYARGYDTALGGGM